MNRESKGRGTLARSLGGAALLCALVIAAIAAAPAQAVVTYSKSFGGSGSGAGQFSTESFWGPGGVAVYEANDHVFVTDPGQNRVQEFDAQGNFVKMWGQGVNQTTLGDVCASGETCQAASVGGVGGAFNQPRGIAIDQDTGDIYVQDAGNVRIQKFNAAGQFVLTWGKGVNFTTGGNFCTAASGNVCQAGKRSGSTATTPKTITPPGLFGGWEGFSGPGIDVDEDGFVYVTDPLSVGGEEGTRARIQKFDPQGNFVAQIAPINEGFSEPGARVPSYLDVSDDGSAIYVRDEKEIKVFHADDFTPDGLTGKYDDALARPPTFFYAGPVQFAVDPSNGFLYVGSGNPSPCPESSATGTYRIEYYHPANELIDCTVASSPSISNFNIEGGMAVSLEGKLYVVSGQNDEIRIYDTPDATLPDITGEAAGNITSTKVVLGATMRANLADTTFHVEYGPQPCSVSACQSTAETASIGAAAYPKDVSQVIDGLTPASGYYYRFVATNSAGTEEGADRKFATFPSPSVDNDCQNNLARQQTRATLLLDCRAYELVSAESTGGYNVESDLVPNGEPFGGFPLAGDNVLYAVKDGGIPGIEGPTNRGPDPYVATRDGESGRWNTEYVGMPADAPSAEPFSSTVAGADSGLDTFAFGGPDICSPCFDDGTAGLPVRTPNGELVQGMGGSIEVAEPEPAGEIRKPLSADGSQFVFGSKQQFEPTANSSGTDLTVYKRNLETGATQVVSTDDNGDTIAAGDDVAQLDVSEDGSRVLIGVRLGTDSGGNSLWQLYMHTGGAGSIDLTPGVSEGVRYAGMTANGAIVYFTSPDQFADDGDGSADLFRADVSGTAATLSRVSAGTGGAGDTDSCDPAGNSYNSSDWNALPGGPTDCSVVAIGGAGGVASQSGAVYFLSPEQLDGDGVDGAPNLFKATPGGSPEFVETLESGANAPLQPASHVFTGHFGSFQNPSGAAIDPVTGASYIWDIDSTEGGPGAYVQKFNADGSADSSFGSGGKVDGTGSPTGPFLSFGNGAVAGLSMGVPTSIAVDTNPASANYRDVFVADVLNSVVSRFSSSGAYEHQFSVNFPGGVAIDPTTGNVVVAGLFGTIQAYTPAGAPTGPAITIPFFTAGDVAVDTTGRTFFTDGSSTTIYDSAGVEQGKLGSGASYQVDVDPTDDHIYVSKGDRVIEYTPGGTPVGGPIGVGQLNGSLGVAAHAGRVTATSPGDGKAASFTAPITPPSRDYDNPFVINAVKAPETRRTTDFQTNAGGEHAVFPSSLPLTGIDSEGMYNIYRADGAGIECPSCNETLATPVADASLASNGLSLTDDGRVFFTSGEPLVLRDDNSKKDAYQWTEGTVELISTGKDTFDSGLLSVSADGRDAFFFTRETLATNDGNGRLMKIYDAREGGGFFTIPPAPPCAASDECHGPGTQSAVPPHLGSLEGTGGNVVEKPLTCKRGFVKRNGKCVKKPRKKKKGKKNRKGKRHTGGRNG